MTINSNDYSNPADLQSIINFYGLTGTPQQIADNVNALVAAGVLNSSALTGAQGLNLPSPQPTPYVPTANQTPGSPNFNQTAMTTAGWPAVAGGGFLNNVTSQSLSPAPAYVNTPDGTGTGSGGVTPDGTGTGSGGVTPDGTGTGSGGVTPDGTGTGSGGVTPDWINATPPAKGQPPSMDYVFQQMVYKNIAGGSHLDTAIQQVVDQVNQSYPGSNFKAPALPTDAQGQFQYQVLYNMATGGSHPDTAVQQAVKTMQTGDSSAGLKITPNASFTVPTGTMPGSGALATLPASTPGHDSGNAIANFINKGGDAWFNTLTGGMVNPSGTGSLQVGGNTLSNVVSNPYMKGDLALLIGGPAAASIIGGAATPATVVAAGSAGADAADVATPPPDVSTQPPTTPPAITNPPPTTPGQSQSGDYTITPNQQTTLTNAGAPPVGSPGFLTWATSPQGIATLASMGLTYHNGQLMSTAASQATAGQTQAATAALAQQQRQFNAIYGNIDPRTGRSTGGVLSPAITQGQNAITALGDRYNPASRNYKAPPTLTLPDQTTFAQNIKNDPAYKFQLQQGEEALNASRAATGGYFSGETGVELQKLGQGLASSNWEQYYNNATNNALMQYNAAMQRYTTPINTLQSMSGTGMQATGQLTNAAMQNSANTTNLLTGIAGVNAAANVANAQTQASMYNGILNTGISALGSYNAQQNALARSYGG